ncbi:MFS transporter [Lasiodiplodia theobromae]|uniref:MFS transporter n=1 Tax=Lasiodiplodia theobromae TaxID=45133 RepID=UPI0015C338E6|nr:MFS transporter [Lasiodiplodia theobromae]KAF4540318.1 MFS transporter [Lasiodiplodia theobromae]
MTQNQDLEISRAVEQAIPANDDPRTEATEEPAIIEAMDIQVPDATAPSRSNFRVTAIMMALYLALFVAALDQTIVSTAIPTITSSLHSASGYTWIGGAYLLAKSAAMPIWAKLSDIWGRKPIILASLSLFFAASILCALAQTMPMLISGRALQGVGGGGLLQLVDITIADLFSLRRRSLFIALTELMWAIAAGIGPVLGGVLAAKVSWRWIFWLNLPIAGAAFVLTLLFLDVHNPRTRLRAGLAAVDWLGTATMLGLTLMLLLALNMGGVVAAWSSAKIVCLLVFGVLMVVGFVVSEQRFATHPIMPLRLFRDRSNVAAFAAAFCSGFVFIAAEYYLPLYFQSSRAADPILSGVLILPLITTEAVAAVGTGVGIHASGQYKPFLQAGMLVTVVGVGLFTLFDARTSTATVVGIQILAGAGIGLCFQPPMTAVQARVKQRDVATATGTLGFVKNIATALSIVVGGVVFQNGVAMQRGKLVAAGMEEAVAEMLAGPEAAANVEMIGRIADEGQRWAAEQAFASGLRNMWILYACVAGCGVVASLFVKRSVLSREHTETKTGLLGEGEGLMEGGRD